MCLLYYISTANPAIYVKERVVYTSLGSSLSIAAGYVGSRNVDNIIGFYWYRNGLLIDSSIMQTSSQDQIGFSTFDITDVEMKDIGNYNAEIRTGVGISADSLQLALAGNYFVSEMYMQYYMNSIICSLIASVCQW